MLAFNMLAWWHAVLAYPFYSTTLMWVTVGPFLPHYANIRFVDLSRS